MDNNTLPAYETDNTNAEKYANEFGSCTMVIVDKDGNREPYARERLTPFRPKLEPTR